MEEELIMNDEFSEETVSNIEAENDPLVAEPAETIGNVASENENESSFPRLWHYRPSCQGSNGMINCVCSPVNQWIEVR